MYNTKTYSLFLVCFLSAAAVSLFTMLVGEDDLFGTSTVASLRKTEPVRGCPTTCSLRITRSRHRSISSMCHQVSPREFRSRFLVSSLFSASRSCGVMLCGRVRFPTPASNRKKDREATSQRAWWYSCCCCCCCCDCGG